LLTFWFLILRLIILRLLTLISKWSLLLCLWDLKWSESWHLLFYKLK
jgi:hypothetical protein